MVLCSEPFSDSQPGPAWSTEVRPSDTNQKCNQSNQRAVSSPHPNCIVFHSSYRSEKHSSFQSDEQITGNMSSTSECGYCSPKSSCRCKASFKDEDISVVLSASAESVPDRLVSCHIELSTNVPRGIYGPQMWHLKLSLVRWVSLPSLLQV